jgi:hypothetical protein
MLQRHRLQTLNHFETEDLFSVVRVEYSIQIAMSTSRSQKSELPKLSTYLHLVRSKECSIFYKGRGNIEKLYKAMSRYTLHPPLSRNTLPTPFHV